MKVAVSSNGKTLSSKVGETFGRCSHFIIIGIEEGKIKRFDAIKNLFAQKGGGAGISAAKTVTEKGVEFVIAGNIGPRALSVLKQFGIKFHRAEGVVKDVLKKFSGSKR